VIFVCACVINVSSQYYLRSLHDAAVIRFVCMCDINIEYVWFISVCMCDICIKSK